VAANWQRSGSKGRRPKPLDRPGDKARKRIGTGKMTLSEARVFFDRVNRA
jgi:hypothetical protein